jgi:hypothetical protein
MNTSRRNILLSTLFGTGLVGLRALATGIPASILLNPRRALAGGCPATAAKPQYVILCTSGNGDPINANVPGCYGITNLYTCPDPTMMAANLTVGTTVYKAATPWAMMANLDPTRTQFWHLMTNTPVHPKEPDVLRLMSAINPAEMFPSFLSKNLAAALGTIQTQPVCVGAQGPSEGLTFNGAALPIIPPTALKSTLVSDPKSPLNMNKLQSLRDSSLKTLTDVYLNNGASPAQQSFIKSYVNSQTDLRNINAGLLSSLADLNMAKYPQVDAAIALIRMNVTPVVSIHIPFGGDNHHDNMYQAEATQTVSGCAELDYLLGQLKLFTTADGRSLADAVTVISLNVFGRTLLYDAKNGDGRQHNPYHHVAFVVGQPFKGGVYGGVAQLPSTMGGDFGCTAMSSATGAGGGGDIKPVDTLAAWGMTVATGVGVDPNVISAQMSSNPNVNPSGMNTAKVVCAALA